MPSKPTPLRIQNAGILLAATLALVGCGVAASAAPSAHEAKAEAHTFVQGFMAKRRLPQEALGTAERQLEQAALESPHALGETAAHLFWEGWTSVVFPTTLAYEINERQVAENLPPAARAGAKATLEAYRPIVELD